MFTFRVIYYHYHHILQVKQSIDNNIMQHQLKSGWV